MQSHQAAARAVRDETSRELRRYRADVLAAHMPAGSAALCGAMAGFLVFFVPLVVVGGSMLFLSFFLAIGILPFRWLVETFFRRGRVPASGPGRAPATGSGAAGAPGAGAPAARPTDVPPLPAEGTMETTSSTPWGAVGLVVFWPLLLFATGALLGVIYHQRRSRRLDDLRRSPLDFAPFPEALVFYVITAGAGLLVGLDYFVALIANAAFAWIGYLIWRWLFDVFAQRLAPASAREASLALLEKEVSYRHRLREEG
ncbi:MAG: hypothetical protein AVDCRST_MAG77-1411 [uncultured Chloroflexi bacterium]|uniref:Uncharacterized protein n=1 Tax=uncultured Chloroflexota bacterium TaxID=166587 RepID=A0A6J4I2U2_9CHLR|nr:MAG: hypothetical protein AVDCRST_MAG77-1411 [uncultured Chloroflexota bacterium]